ncbi:hypothetical protein [Nocardioides sp.]|uniref:hypothetical protein n=1 Tax=Nocardioides sp. TaxID=35761 RepID=UPI002ED1A560
MARTRDQLSSTTLPASAEALLGDLETPGGPLRLEAFPYAFGSPATGGLYRLHGPDWCWFGKLLQHVRHWPALPSLPPAVAEEFVADFPWRSELVLWDPGFSDRMPEGLRPPVLHGLVELPDDKVMVWMEDVRQSALPPDLDLFRRAAHLLGRWNARCTAPAALAVSDYPPGYALRMYAEKAVAHRGLGPLADDQLWSNPRLAEHLGLRADLQRLAERIPAMLDRLDGYVQALPHGDASPQNLLVPAEEPDTFVVIDPSFTSPHALGFDLGQLLVGLVHAGDIPAATLPDIVSVIVPAYQEGLAAEGIDDQAEAARDGFVTGVQLRSGFDSFLFDLIGTTDPAERHVFDERVALCRFLADLYLDEHPDD